MKVLIACEESQRVCIEFRKLGHEAYSCDIEEPSGGYPQWHIQGDVSKIVNGFCKFKTMDGEVHTIEDKWDLIIAHPPCTYLSTVCNRAYSLKHNSPLEVIDRYKKRDEAIKFFMLFVNADCERICVENPMGYMNTHFKKPTQTIHPYYFASSNEDEENYHMKRTCLWLKGLPRLQRINTLDKPEPMYISNGEKTRGRKINWCEGIRGVKGGRKERSKARSKTFKGIAKAMANQWG